MRELRAAIPTSLPPAEGARPHQVVGKITPPTENTYQFWEREDVHTCARIRRKVRLAR